MGQSHRSTPQHRDVLVDSTPVFFRGHQPSARVATVGINPSVREFFARGGEELTGTRRRFETLSSLRVDSMGDATDAMMEQIQQRCLEYFEVNPYMKWFIPIEAMIHAITGASYFDGSACHLDLVQWATKPLWGQLDRHVREELLSADRAFVAAQLGSGSLDVIYLNGRTVCDAVSGFVPLSSRAARFRGEGTQRHFFRGVHGRALVVGCSSNIQEERLRTADRQDFLAWIVDECRRDLEALRSGSTGARSEPASSP